MNLNGKHTPLNLNCLGSLIQNSGLRINPTAATYMGSSTGLSNYTKGSVVSQTVLGTITDVIRLAYPKFVASTITSTVYNNLISIGSTTIPALGNSKPSTYTNSYSGELTSYGFLRLIPLQARNEFYVDGTLSYSNFLSTFSATSSFKNRINSVITGYLASHSYLEGAYSNMNDLISGDITGVSISTFYWGRDLINSGKAIDLSSIDTFGNPANLLRTLNKHRALSNSVILALLSAGIDSGIIEGITNGKEATNEQQNSIYAAFKIIIGNDLSDALIPLNCQTKGLDSLADLLNPKKLFPSSYQTLTIPVYNTKPGPTNSKTYYLIYNNGDTNIIGDKYGNRLQQVMPKSIAYAADAFGTSMMQIKNIKTMEIEKFSQVVTSLENASDLAVNGTSKPCDTDTANVALSAIANGSGENGLYTMCDFFGSMSGLSYDWKTLKSKIEMLSSPSLLSVYVQMKSVLEGVDYSTLQTLIDSANSIISNIKTNNLSVATELNDLYNKFGTNLRKEQNARTLALGDLSSLTTTVGDIMGFMENINQYSLETELYGPAQILEAISDTTTLGGNSLIGSMREVRNAHRLGLTGAEQDNSVESEPLRLPKISGTVPTPLITEGPLVGVVAITGAATTPGSLAGSQETTLIPDNLDLFNITHLQPSVIVPNQAVQDVIDCNCDCWDLLT